MMPKFPALLAIALLLSSPVGAQSSDYLSDFLKKWQNAAAYTLEVAELMPADAYDYRPTPEVDSFREQLLHSVSNMVWLSTSYLGGEGWAVDLKREDYTKAEVLDILRTAFDYSTRMVEALDAPQLAESVDFFAGPMNKRQILQLMNDHLTHHRRQAIQYLRQKGIKPPAYRGW